MHRTWQLLTLAIGLTFASAPVWAQLNACDLNSDGIVDVSDVQLAVNMSVGSTTCTANIMGSGVCNVIVVQRVVNAALGQGCVTGSGHTAALTWVASTSAGVAGYNVYRGTVSGGPYTLVNSTPVAAVTYTDSGVAAGTTYYYVVRSVGSDGSLSAASSQVTASVPTP
jgi:hypothetical protein